MSRPVRRRHPLMGPFDEPATAPAESAPQIGIVRSCAAARPACHRLQRCGVRGRTIAAGRSAPSVCRTGYRRLKPQALRRGCDREDTRSERCDSQECGETRRRLVIRRRRVADMSASARALVRTLSGRRAEATQTGFSTPSHSTVASITARSPRDVSSIETTRKRPRTRPPDGTGAGKRTRSTP